MDLLVLGGSGQLGAELRSMPATLGVRIVAPTRDQLDILSAANIAEWISAKRWSAVINAAAYTDVDRAETEQAAAFALNATAPSQLAAETDRHDIPLIQISTDYVFDGRKHQPYVPADTVKPINVYGHSKEAGEAGVRANNPRHMILRTSWLYSPFRKNFVKTILRLGAERDRLTVVNDQRGCPTAAHDLARACLAIANRVSADPDRAAYGTYHYAGAGDTTWCGFAQAIFDLARPRLPSVPVITGIATADYPTPAKRPADARLDCASTVKTWDIALRDWRVALEDTLARYFAKEAA